MEPETRRDAVRTRLRARRWRRPLLALASLTFVLALPTAAAAAPPGNDDFENAQAVTAGATAGTNVDATKQTGEPNHDGDPGGKSVWFTYTAPATRDVVLDLCQSTFDLAATVYTGASLTTLTPLADVQYTNSCPSTGGLGYATELRVTAGQTYRIAIDGARYSNVASSGTFTLRIVERPVNDDFADTLALAGVAPTAAGTTANSTLETTSEEYLHDTIYDRGSLWYSWTAPFTGQASVGCAAGVGTFVQVYSGSSLGALLRVSSTAFPCDDAERTIAVTEGVTYRIAMLRDHNGSSAFTLRLTPSVSNDTFPGTTLPSDLAHSRGAVNYGATKQEEEADHAGDPGGASVWYRWQAPADGTVTVDTCGSAIDTLLAAYRLPPSYYDPMLAQAVLAAANDDATCGTPGQQSRVTIPVQRHEWLALAIDGKGGAVGQLRFNLSFAAPPPPHDDLADAITLPGSARVNGQTYEATAETGEPEHAGGSAGHSVWYRWQPTVSGPAVIDLCESQYDTTLAVYTGTSGDLDEIASNDDVPYPGYGEWCDPQSKVSFDAIAGTEYLIAVDGSDSPAASYADWGHFTLLLRGPQLPPNDAFAAAELLEGLADSASGWTTGATTEAGETPIGGGGGWNFPSGKTIWYRWTAPASGVLDVSTCGSDHETSAAIYTVDGGVRTERNYAVGGWSCGGRAEFNHTVTRGTTYWIAVDGMNNQTGIVELDLAMRRTGNDFDDRRHLHLNGEDQVSDTVDNGIADKETGEPDHAGDAGGRSMWWNWTAPVDGEVTLDTCDSEIDTLLAVYVGRGYSELDPVAADDDGICDGVSGPQSRLTFTAERGQEYRIAVDGKDGDEGAASLLLRLAAVPPPNDDFADATTITGELVDTRFSTHGASREAGEPDHNGADPQGRSVWFTWTAPRSADVGVRCDGYAVPSIRVYTGSAVGALTATGSEGPCGWQFTATAGTTYRIAVELPYQIEASILLRTRPANDQFAAAQVLSGSTASASGDRTLATTEAWQSAPEQRDVWFRWTAPQTGPFRLDLCDGNGGHSIAVHTYAGSAPTPASAAEAPAIAQSGYASDCGYPQHVTFDATAGATYFFRVWGADYGGSYALALSPNGAPANDAFASPVALSGDQFNRSGTTRNATYEAGETTYEPSWGSGSVWYTWTAPVSRRVKLRSCGIDTILTVGTGTSIGDLAPVATADDVPGACGSETTASRVTFDAVAGTTYRILVAARTYGAFTLRLAPANDDFGAARTLTTDETATGTTIGSSGQDFEPSHAAHAPERTVWYRWTAPHDGRAGVDTCGSALETVLGVYTGLGLSGLDTVGSNHQASPPCPDGAEGSRVTFTAVAGTTYRIAVGEAYQADPAEDAITVHVGYAPVADTLAATELAHNSARGHGSVDRNGQPTTYHFQYGPTTAYGSRTADVAVPSGSGVQPVDQTISGLDPGTTYHYRLVALSRSGRSFGPDRTFTTDGVAQLPPEASTDPASSLSITGATLNATVNPRGWATSYRFDYKLASTTAWPDPATGIALGNGMDALPVTRTLSDLQPNTAYDFRVVAVNTHGTTTGAVRTFTTQPVPLPAVTPAAATALTPTGATLNGSVDPNGWATTYHFEYGTTTAYGSRSPATDASAGTGDAPVAVSRALSGLAPSTTYHFRLVATNAGGTARSADGTFTTPATPVPDPDPDPDPDPTPIPTPQGGNGGSGAGGSGGSSNPPADGSAPQLGLSIALKRLGVVLAKGLTVRGTCSEACTLSAQLLLDRRAARGLGIAAAAKPVIVGRATKRLAAAGAGKLVVKLTANARRRMGKARSVRLTLKLIALDASGNAATTQKKLTLKR